MATLELHIASGPSPSPHPSHYAMRASSGKCLVTNSPHPLEMARHDKALASLSFDGDTKLQLNSLPLSHKKLFGGKLDEASKQAEERGHHQHELKVSVKVPQAQTQASSASAPSYTIQACVLPS